MQLGRQSDHRRCLAGMFTHGVLRLVSIGDHSRQGAVIANRTGQHVRDLLFLAGIDNAVIKIQIFNCLGDGTALTDFVKDIQMIIMAERLQCL